MTEYWQLRRPSWSARGAGYAVTLRSACRTAAICAQLLFHQGPANGCLAGTRVAWLFMSAWHRRRATLPPVGRGVITSDLRLAEAERWEAVLNAARSSSVL